MPVDKEFSPQEKLCLALERFHCELAKIGFTFVEGMQGNEGQFMYPTIFPNGEYGFQVLLRKVR